jgi:hypothetical protein
VKRIPKEPGSIRCSQPPPRGPPHKKEIFVPVSRAEPTDADSKGDALDEKWRSCAKPQRALQSHEPRDESIKVRAKMVRSRG